MSNTIRLLRVFISTNFEPLNENFDSASATANQ